MPATSTPATSSGSRPTRSSARAAQTSEDGVRDNTEAQGSIEKGKKRASTAAPAEVRVTRRRASGVNEAAASASTPVPVKAEESSARSKKNRGRASGVTRFWRNNSSIAGRSALAPSKKKDFMQSGMYCQDPDPNSPRKLVNRVLSRRDAELAAARKKGRAAVAAAKAAGNERLVFPPMPYDYGEQHFFEQEHEFVLPYDIQWAAENGTLDAKKRPVAYQKVRQNAFPERTKVGSDVTAVCRCTQESGCDENCDNRIMHYTCGKDCPAGENCSNKSLWKRKQPAVKIVNTGQRGFGLFAAEDIKEGDFVIDYRGEVIALDTFYDRCRKEYAKSKNYYALAYDQDEVIDAAVRGNEARFINHGCQPNLEVRKVSTLGEGLEEFEVGMWASKDIAAGEELCYDYNFDSFAAADATECKCGAPNCVGYLGRKPGEKSAKEKALEAELSATNKKQVKKQAKMAVKSAMKKASVKGKKVAVSVKKGKTKASEATKERDKRVKMRQLRVLKAQRAAEAAAEASQGGQTPSNARGSMPPPSGTSFDIDPSIPQSAPGPSRRGKKSEDPLTPAPRKSKIPKDAPGEEDSPLSEPDEAARKKEEARKRRISGWADWLKKKASEKSRTREEWQDFANKRRRGKAWMESMMQEYGVAAYEGGPAEPYTSPLSDIPATGQPKKRGPPPGTPRAPRQPKPKPADPVDPAPETTVDETDAERALRSIYPEFEAENHGEPSNSIPDFDQSVVDLANSVALDADVFDPAAVDFDVAAEQLFGANSVDYFETQQRYGLTQDDTAGGEQPFTLAQVQSGVVDDQAEQLRQRANAIVSSIQPQLP